jgi:hypothetical protein
MSREISLEAARKLVDNYVDVFTDEELADYMNAAIDSSPGMAMLTWSAIGTKMDAWLRTKDQDRIVALWENVNSTEFVNILQSGIPDIEDYRYFRHGAVEAGKLIDGSLVLETFEDGKTTVLKDGNVQDLLSVSCELKQELNK